MCSSDLKICKDFLSLPKQVRKAKGLSTYDLCKENFNYENTFDKLYNLISNIKQRNTWNSNKLKCEIPKLETIINLSDYNFISELIKNMFFIDKEEIISRTLKMLNFGFKNKQTIYSEIEKMCKSFNYYESLR